MINCLRISFFVFLMSFGISENSSKKWGSGSGGGGGGGITITRLKEGSANETECVSLFYSKDLVSGSLDSRKNLVGKSLVNYILEEKPTHFSFLYSTSIPQVNREKLMDWFLKVVFSDVTIKSFDPKMLLREPPFFVFLNQEKPFKSIYFEVYPNSKMMILVSPSEQGRNLVLFPE